MIFISYCYSYAGLHKIKILIDLVGQSVGREIMFKE